MLKIRKWETSDVMGLKLLGRAYITILENKESVFCLRKWAIVITMAIEIDHSNNLHKMCSSFIFGMFQRAIRPARLSTGLNFSRAKPISDSFWISQCLTKCLHCTWFWWNSIINNWDRTELKYIELIWAKLNRNDQWWQLLTVFTNSFSFLHFRYQKILK